MCPSPSPSPRCSPEARLTSNWQVLQTKFMNEQGVVSVTGNGPSSSSRADARLTARHSPDYLPRPRQPGASAPVPGKPLLPWLVRRVEVIRGTVPLLMQCAPAFNYARSAHVTTVVDDDSAPGPRKKVLFESDALALDLRYVCETTLVRVPPCARVLLAVVC